MIVSKFLTKLFGKQPTRGDAIKGMNTNWLKRSRAEAKMNAEGLSKNLKDPKFRKTAKIKDYKNQKYYG